MFSYQPCDTPMVVKFQGLAYAILQRDSKAGLNQNDFMNAYDDPIAGLANESNTFDYPLIKC